MTAKREAERMVRVDAEKSKDSDRESALCCRGQRGAVRACREDNVLATSGGPEWLCDVHIDMPGHVGLTVGEDALVAIGGR